MLRGSVSAAASSATAQQQRLDVSKQHEPPRFVQPISGLDVPEGGQAVFEVVVSGKPLPDVAWFHEGRPIQHGPDFQVDARPPTCWLEPYAVVMLLIRGSLVGGVAQW